MARNCEISADLLSEEVIGVSVTRYLYRMLTTFAQEGAGILLEMVDEIDALHLPATTSGSRITSLP